MRALILGHLWASANTIAGLIVALAGATPAGCDGVCLLFVARRRGPVAWFFRSSGMAAFTWGAVVVVAEPHHLERVRLIRHEHRHVAQQLVLGPLMPIAYGLCSLVAWLAGGDAYYDNALERDARAHE